jgi:hypothetical protein
MRYVSVYTKNNSLKKIFTVVGVLVILIPGLAMVLPPLIAGTPMPKEQTLPLLMTMGACVLAAIFMQFAYRQMVSLSVEVTDSGIQHFAPGREKIIMWQDVVEARIVPYGKHDRAVRIKTPNQRYVFPPHLVPDSFDAPDYKVSFPSPYWQYPDGRKERADVLHSFGAKLVRQYRPDLATGKLELKDGIKI